MRIVKEANTRKNEIMDVAAKLFQTKGYDKTSTNDILDAVGIARGTLYHHFKSKEDIMDALIERQTEYLLIAARKIAEDKSIPVEERIMRTVMSLNASELGEESTVLMEHLHQPQNALMHQKINRIIMVRVPSILSDIIKDGISQGLFETPYPLECMEMIVVYLQTVFDDGIFELTKQEYAMRIQAFIFHLERLLGVTQGKFSFVSQLFERDEAGDK